MRVTIAALDDLILLAAPKVIEQVTQTSSFGCAGKLGEK
jgi:hypothetical protein